MNDDKKGHQKEITIIVNGNPHNWPKGASISYAEIVTLAIPDYPQHPEITYSVKYKKGNSHKPEGVLAPGGSVELKDDMIFTVTESGQS